MIVDDQIEERASLENPAVSLTDPATFNEAYGFNGPMASSGQKVTPESSIGIPAVWQAVSMISGDVARLPFDVYKRTDKGKEVDKRHPAWHVVRRQANDEETAFRFWRKLMVHALIWGNGYAWIRMNGRGEVSELIPLLPDRTKFCRYLDGRGYFQTELSTGPSALRDKSNGGVMATLYPHEVLHLSGMSLGRNFSHIGEAIVHAARDAWGLALAQQHFASRFFRSGGRVGGTLEIPLQASEGYADKLEGGFRKNYENDDAWFRTVILRDGAKFHAASTSPKESQLEEVSERQVREVARFYNMNPARLGVAGSVSYNSQSESNQSYLDTTLSVWLADISAECDRKLLSKQQRENDSHYFEHNELSLLRMNAMQRAQVYAIGIRNKYLTVNEVRQAEGYPDIEGGDEIQPDPPKSPGGIDKGEDNKPRGPANDEGEEDPVDDKEEKSARVDIARRIYLIAEAARRKSANQRAYQEWINSGLPKLAGKCEVAKRFAAGLAAATAFPVSDLAATVDQVSRQYESEVI